jgi:hypothetical protein
LVTPRFVGILAGEGRRYLRLFERCAVVSDQDWIRTGVRVVGAVLPCPVGRCGNGEWQEGVEWLRSPAEASLDFQILADRGVAVVKPRGKLSAADFDALAAAVDHWIEGPAGALNGLVVHGREFPGWEDLGSAWPICANTEWCWSTRTAGSARCSTCRSSKSSVRTTATTSCS